MINLARLQDDLAMELEHATINEATEAECSLWELIGNMVHLLRSMKEDGLLTPRDNEIPICYPGVY